MAALCEHLRRTLTREADAGLEARRPAPRREALAGIEERPEELPGRSPGQTAANFT